jgi:hypothetical protein
MVQHRLKLRQPPCRLEKAVWHQGSQLLLLQNGKAKLVAV